MEVPWGTLKWMVYIWEDHLQMDDLGVPPLMETPKYLGVQKHQNVSRCTVSRCCRFDEEILWLEASSWLSHSWIKATKNDFLGAKLFDCLWPFQRVALSRAEYSVVGWLGGWCLKRFVDLSEAATLTWGSLHCLAPSSTGGNFTGMYVDNCGQPVAFCDCK